MRHAVRVFQRFSQHHIASAFTMHRLRLRKLGKRRLEARCGSQLSGEKLWITAGQPADIAGRVRSFIGKRREGKDFGAGLPPLALQMRVEEGEGGVFGQGNALSGRGNSRFDRPFGQIDGRCQSKQRIEIDGASHRIGQSFDMGVDFRVFARLHQTEMPFGQGQRWIAHDAAGHRKANLFDRVGAKRAMAFAPRTVQNDGGHLHRRIVMGKAMGHGRRRLRLARDIEDQEDGDVKEPRQIGGRAGAVIGDGNAVEETHGAFDKQKIRTVGLLGQKVAQQIRLHRPAVQVEAGRTGCDRMKAGIDVIRSGLDAAHLDAAAGKGAQQSDGDAGLAGAGAGRADDDGFCGHGRILNSGRAFDRAVGLLFTDDGSRCKVYRTFMETDGKNLRRGWTTGTCAAAATKAACQALLTGSFPDLVDVELPNGSRPAFVLATEVKGDGFARAGIVKDAGDDPDVTHGALIESTLRRTEKGSGISFKAGKGVGIVTRPGLPLSVGEPAINPVPRQMILAAIHEVAGAEADFEVEISVRDGETLAEKTLNGRLGIVGGLSILGTTGIVIPFSCSAWIHSIWRGIDVARAEQLPHLLGATGNASEKAGQAFYGLPETALIDMGDFIGGMLKYLKSHPVPRVTVAGGVAKMTKLAQGMLDVHSKRGLADLEALAKLAEEAGATSELLTAIRHANMVAHAFQLAEAAGIDLGNIVAQKAWAKAAAALGRDDIALDILVFDRDGNLKGRTAPTPSNRAAPISEGPIG